MTDTWTPGPGWEQVTEAEFRASPAKGLYVEHDGPGRWFLPRPTEQPYTPSPEATRLQGDLFDEHELTIIQRCQIADAALEAARQQGRDEGLSLLSAAPLDGGRSRWWDERQARQAAALLAAKSEGDITGWWRGYERGFTAGHEGNRMLRPDAFDADGNVKGTVPDENFEGEPLSDDIEAVTTENSQGAWRTNPAQPVAGPGPAGTSGTVSSSGLLRYRDESLNVDLPLEDDEAPDLGPNAMPDRIIIDGKGYGWREWDAHPEMWSMVPQNPDNSPVPKPLTYFVKEGASPLRGTDDGYSEGYARGYARGYERIPEGKVLVPRRGLEQALTFMERNQAAGFYRATMNVLHAALSRDK